MCQGDTVNYMYQQTSGKGEAVSVDDDDRSTDLESAASDEGSPPSREELLEAIHNRRRRYALHYLQRHGGTGPVDLADVSRQVAAWERGIEPDVIRYNDRKNVHTSLYQFHAPKLADLGLVEYDRRSSTIELTKYGRNLRLDLDVTTDRRRDTWSLLIPSGLSIVIVVVALLEVPVLRSVPNVVWTVVVAALFVGSAVVLASSWRVTERIVTQHPPEPVKKHQEERHPRADGGE